MSSFKQASSEKLFAPDPGTHVAWGNEIQPEEAGMKSKGIKNVVEVFHSQVSDRLHFGSQLVVLRYGKVIVDCVAGLANVREKIQVTHDTPFNCFSIGKSFVAMCIHQLAEEGKVCLDLPVAEYWPEFGCKGKEKATLRHVLLHQAGIPSRGLFTHIPLWTCWKSVTNSLAHCPAEFSPGSKTSYHLINYGFILGEIVRRVSGKSIEAYLKEEFLTPLKLHNTSLGLPKKNLNDASHIYSGDLSQTHIAFLFNRGFIRSAVIPAATLYSTARDLAIFFQMLLNQGAYANKRYLKPETIRNAIALGFEGIDENIGAKMHWAMGFHLGGLIRPNCPAGTGMGSKSTLSTFGHFGMNSSMVWADSKYQLVVSFTTNTLLSRQKSTLEFQAISDAVWNTI
jgi:CubicO group peptidase (beta-lactamase class C family)